MDVVRTVALAVAIAISWALAASAQAPPPIGPGQSSKPLNVPAPILVPEAVVVPPPRRVEALPPPQRIQRLRLELVIGGAGLLLSVWAAERLLAQDLTTRWQNWLPLGGAWTMLAQEREKVSPSDAATAFLAIDGLAQAAGATMAVLGLVLRRERLAVRLPAAPAQTISLAPVGNGLALTF